LSLLGRVLILGARGQLGSELQRSFSGAGDLVLSDRTTVDLAREEQIRDCVRSAKPSLILNAAAYTAVDRAESEPELALAINGRTPRVLAEEANRLGALLVHYSTDYVFDGSKQGAWTETDPPNPLNVYGASKLAGEEAIREVGGRYLIFRTSWVYGPHGKNFLLTMLRLGREREQLTIVDDQVGAPTTSVELADATRTILDGIGNGRFGATEEWAGLYHMSCAGITSWYRFAGEIFAHSQGILEGQAPRIVPIRSQDYPSAARRPANSVLSNQKLQSVFGVHLAPWQQALERVLSRLRETAT